MKAITEHTHKITKLVGVGLATLLVAGAAYGTSATIEPSSAYADTPQTQTQAGSWVKSHGKWWYKYADGTYPANGQVSIKGKTYSFDASGYMKTGWKLEDGSWHYYKGSGAMATGWAKSGSRWYYMDSDGIMQTGWQKVDGKWYYLKGSGAMATGWLQDQGSWYYLQGSGAMKTGWLKSGSKWYYMDPADGKMTTGKQIVSGKTYIFASSGAMKTGWVQDGGKWYYATSSGACKTNGWAGNYYLTTDGTMATSGWVDNGKYYVDGSGKWVKNPSKAQLATKPGHEHTWEAVTEQVKVVDERAHTVWQCACGEKFLRGTLCAEHQDAAAMLETEQGLNVGVDGKHGSSKTYVVKEQSHYEDVITGYKCSCGATKAA